MGGVYAHAMFIHNINPTLVQLGPLEIRWYGLVYVLSFFLMVWWMQWLHKRGKFSLDKEQTWDLAFYLTLGVLIGARLFEIFWEPSYYLGNPLRLLRIWEGGMSFHGGFVGAIVACYWWCKRHKIQFYTIADAASAPLMLGLAFGRIANFINGELVGRVFDGNWCVVFPGFEECRHPSTLYAAAKRFAISGGWLS